MGKWTRFFAGMAAGAALCAAFTVPARAGSGTLAEKVIQLVRVDGRQVELNAYEIDGSNYVKLRDIGEMLDFNVYWEDGIFIDSASPYTGKPSGEVIQSIGTPLSPAPEVNVEAVREEIVRLTNELRERKELSLLPEDEKLMQAAQVRAEEMAATGVYDHIRPDGTSRATVTDCIYTTENIHCISGRRMADPGKELAKLAVDEWAASGTHLEAMLDVNRCAVGVGVAKGVDPKTGQEKWYCVQLFLRTGYAVNEVDEPILTTKQ